MINKLPPIDAEDQAWLSDNPNTADIVEYVQAYGQACRDAALEEAVMACRLSRNPPPEPIPIRITLDLANAMAHKIECAIRSLK